MEVIASRCKLVVVPLVLFTGNDQTCLAEVSQMARRSWLRYFQDAHDVANAQLTRLQNVKDSQPCLVRHSSEHAINVGQA